MSSASHRLDTKESTRAWSHFEHTNCHYFSYIIIYFISLFLFLQWKSFSFSLYFIELGQVFFFHLFVYMNEVLCGVKGKTWPNSTVYPKKWWHTSHGHNQPHLSEKYKRLFVSCFFFEVSYSKVIYTLILMAMNWSTLLAEDMYWKWHRSDRACTSFFFVNNFAMQFVCLQK